VIETAGRLDLGHLLARRHGDAERLLDPEILLPGRVHEVDPRRGAVDILRVLARDQYATGSIIDRKHEPLPNPRDRRRRS